MQCFTLTGLVTIIWVVVGYSLAFDTTGMVSGKLNLHSFVGGLGKVFLKWCEQRKPVRHNSRGGFHHLSIDLCDYYACPDCRCLCRADEVFRNALVYGNLVNNRIHAVVPHGLERRGFILQRYPWRIRFCRWDRGAYQRGYCGSGCCLVGWQTRWLSRHPNATT